MDQIAPILQQLADKLGVASEVLWQALLKQAAINAYYRIFVVALTLPLIVIGVRMFFKYNAMRNAATTWTDREYAENYMLGGIALFAIPMLLDLALMGGVFTRLLNPEYWAIQQIMGAF